MNSFKRFYIVNMPKLKNRIFTVHLGCSKNQVDAECLVTEFLHQGFTAVESAEEADYILINTCGFIEPAKEEAIDTILYHLDSRKDGQKIIVTGCLSKRYGEDLKKELPEVDFWAGTYKPGELLKSMGLLEESVDSYPMRLNLSGIEHHAYLKIAEGCDRQCAYCAIPGIRGRQVSRSIADIVKEAKALEKSGVQELTLIAQDTTYYGHEKNAPGSFLIDLLKALLKETNIPWIRTLYWYPAFIDDELLELIASEKRLCKYIDLPIQHASDKVLKSMCRRYSKDELRKMLLNIREKIPGVTLRTTVLVGFPGETEEDFEDLMALLEEIRFEHLGGFVYSPEEGTVAEKLRLPAVSEETARQRLSLVTELQEEISLEKNEALIGKEISVILDEVADESEFHFYGRSEGNSLDVDDIVRVVEGDGSVGTIRRALVIDAGPHELDVKLLPE